MATTSFVVNIVDFLATASPKPTTTTKTSTTSTEKSYVKGGQEGEVDVDEKTDKGVSKEQNTDVTGPETEIEVDDGGFNSVRPNIKDGVERNESKLVGDSAQNDISDNLIDDEYNNAVDDIYIDGAIVNVVDRVVVDSLDNGTLNETSASIEELDADLFLDSSQDLEEVQNIIQVEKGLFSHGHVHGPGQGHDPGHGHGHGHGHG